MFKLKNSERYKISNVKGAQEKHGKEEIPCVDISFKGAESNAVLNMFDTSLLFKFFTFKSDEDQDLVDGVSPTPTKPDMPLTNKEYGIPWEGKGYRLAIPYGVSDKDGLYLIDCKLSCFKFTPKDGGLVDLSFNVRGKLDHECSEIAMAMRLWNGTSVMLTLDPPSAEYRAQMELDEARENLRNNPAA